ncbi:MAG: hypothetical protein ACRECH_12430 [Nitrososphaerales archaeon]
MILDYVQVAEITGLVTLSAFGFYAIRLVASFRTGLLAKSWKQVTAGAIFLISAQIPFLASGIGVSGGDSFLIATGTLMRFVGVVFLVIGLRAQSRVWRPDKGPPLRPDRASLLSSKSQS